MSFDGINSSSYPVRVEAIIGAKIQDKDLYQGHGKWCESCKTLKEQRKNCKYYFDINIHELKIMEEKWKGNQFLNRTCRVCYMQQFQTLTATEMCQGEITHIYKKYVTSRIENYVKNVQEDPEAKPISWTNNFLLFDGHDFTLEFALSAMQDDRLKEVSVEKKLEYLSKYHASYEKNMMHYMKIVKIRC